MKKNIIRLASLGAIIGAAMAFTACSEIDEPQGPATPDQKEITEDGTFTVNFECTLPDEDEATRTEFHDNTIWWSKGDQLRFAQYAQVKGAYTYKSTSNQPLKNISKTISFAIGSFNIPDANTDAAYFSVFPLNGVYSEINNIIYPLITLQSSQTPSTLSYDPNSDLLISQYEHNISKDEDGKYTVKLKYKRMVAMSKMTIKNLPSSNFISSIAFSAKKSGNDVEIAGSRFYDLINGVPSTLSSSSCTKEYTITLDYSDQNITANSSTGMTAYFMCYPFELVSGDSFKVVVTTTAGEIFSREVTIPSGRTLAFKEGKGSIFSVDMKSASVQKPCDWFEISQSTSSDNITISQIKTMYFKPKGSSVTISSIQYKYLKSIEYDPSIDYFANGATFTTVSADNITRINNGTQINSTHSSLDIDTEYTILYKVTISDGESVILKRTARTDWFKLDATTRADGGIYAKMYGAGLASTTKRYAVVPKTELTDVTDLQSYYLNTIKVKNYGQEYIDDINEKNGAAYLVSQSKDWHGTALVSGETYVVMMQATNERGETTFRIAEAMAK